MLDTRLLATNISLLWYKINLQEICQLAFPYVAGPTMLNRVGIIGGTAIMDNISTSMLSLTTSTTRFEASHTSLVLVKTLPSITDDWIGAPLPLGSVVEQLQTLLLPPGTTTMSLSLSKPNRMVMKFNFKVHLYGVFCNIPNRWCQYVINEYISSVKLLPPSPIILGCTLFLVFHANGLYN